MGRSPSELASYVLPLYEQFLALTLAAGLPCITEDTGRTLAEQQADLAAGRSWTKNSKHLPQKPEGKSEAWDSVPRALVGDKYWGWHGTLENSDHRWLQLGEIGEGLGLEWGGRWPIDPPHSRPDPGHFQYVHQQQPVELNNQGDA